MRVAEQAAKAIDSLNGLEIMGAQLIVSATGKSSEEV